jgi:hypothetical protein
MEIPSQLQYVLATLSPEESAEIQHLIGDLPAGDTELSTLICDNLDSLVQVLVDDISEPSIGSLN